MTDRKCFGFQRKKSKKKNTLPFSEVELFFENIMLAQNPSHW